MRFSLFTHGDVADRSRHQDSLRAFQRAQHDLDRELASIFPPSIQLNPGTDLLRKRVFRGSESVREQPFREPLRNDILHLLSYEFIAPVPELLLRLNI